MDEHRLLTEEIPFAVWTQPADALTGGVLPGQGVHRFYRFAQPMQLSRLVFRAPVLYAGLDGASPRHVTVFAYQGDLASRQVVFDGELPLLRQGETYALPLAGVVAHATSVLCDVSYPLDVTEAGRLSILHPTTYTLPFNLLDGLQWFGSEAAPRSLEVPFQPPLQRGSIDPHPVPGQTATADALEVRFSSGYLSVGFSLKRPRLTCLGWEALGTGAHDNYLYRLVPLERELRGLTGANGPYLFDLHYDASPLAWTGHVEVEGNRVRYSGLHVRPGWTVSAEFEVGERSLSVRLQQSVERAFTVLDAGAWCFLWDGRASAVSTLAMPIRVARRNGGVEPRGAFAAPGRGALNFGVEPGHTDLALQIDSTGFHGRTAMAGVQLATQHHPDGTVTVQAGEHAATLRLDVRAIEPIPAPGVAALPEGLQRSWGSTFAFRPEGGGFSNNGYSINCQNCLYFQADLAPYTARRPDEPDLVELVRFTATLAVQGGPGYGASWETAMDAAPSLAISLARVHQARPDRAWLRGLWPYLRRPFDYLLAHLDASGLYVHPYYTGNAGEASQNCNMWDTICFGHYDAYSGALAYRALRGGVALARDAGDLALAERCHAAAAALKAAYVPTLLNPATGLIAGWRSADGELHDHAYTYVNGAAIAYGLVEGDLARSILTTLEAERLRLGHDDFRYGLCLNLRPVPRAHYLLRTWGSPARADGLDTFGVYINGSLTPAGAYFYLRALSQYGFTAAADQICSELLASFAQLRFDGGPHSGVEYFTLDGMPCGYEGSLTHVPHVLLAIAQHRGDVQTLEPEWWPA
jgi:hypothetical protein